MLSAVSPNVEQDVGTYVTLRLMLGHMVLHLLLYLFKIASWEHRHS